MDKNWLEPDNWEQSEKRNKVLKDRYVKYSFVDNWANWSHQLLTDESSIELCWITVQSWEIIDLCCEVQGAGQW